MNFRETFVSSILAMSAATATSAMAATDAFTYQFHPMSPMTLGKGSNPRMPTQEKNICFNFEQHFPENKAALSTTADVYLARSNRDLRIILGMDSSVDASFLVFKAGGSFQLNSDLNFKRNSVTMVVQAKTDFGRIMAKNFQVLPYYKELIEKGKMTEFVEDCGSRVVTTEWRAVSVSILVTVEDLSDDEMIKFSMSGSGGGSFGPISAEMKSNFNTTVHRKASQRKVNYKIIAQGGKGIATLDGVISSALSSDNVLDTLRDSLKNFVNGFDFDHSAPVKFKTMPIPYYYGSHENLMSAEKEKFLSRMVEQYRRVAAKYDQVYGLLNPPEDYYDPRVKYFLYDTLIQANAELPVIDGYLKTVAKTHRACLDAGADDLSQCQMPMRPKTLAFDLVGSTLLNLADSK